MITLTGYEFPRFSRPVNAAATVIPTTTASRQKGPPWRLVEGLRHASAYYFFSSMVFIFETANSAVITYLSRI